jgi:hypothetical protein
VRSVAPRRVLLLDWAAREARTTISSRKSEIRLSLPHDDSAIPHGLTARSVPAALHARGKSTRKNLPSFFPRNPLISRDSDERIQGNPRKSNPHNRGYSERNSQEPRKSKRDRLSHVAARRGPYRRLARPDSCPHHEASQRPDGGERGQAGAAREVDGREMREQ